MSAEYNDYSPEEQNDIPRPQDVGGPLGDDQEAQGIKGLMPEDAGGRLPSKGVVFNPRVDTSHRGHFPVDKDLADDAVRITVVRMSIEGPDEVLDQIKSGLGSTNPGFHKRITDEEKRITTISGTDTGKSYVMGALLGHEVLDAQSDGRLPEITKDIVTAAARSLMEERLLQNIASERGGLYTRPEGPESAYRRAVGRAAPDDTEKTTLGYGAFWAGANEAYRLFKGASEARTLHRIYTTPRNPHA